MMTLASIAVLIAALYFAKGILVPVTLAALLTFLLSPVGDWLERRGLGRIPAVIITTFLGFSVLGIVIWTAAVQMTNLAPRMPEYQHNIEVKLSAVNEYAVTALRKLTRTAEGLGQELSKSEIGNDVLGTGERPVLVRVVSSPVSPLQVFGGLFGTVFQVFGTAAMVVVFVIFFLYRREDLRDRFIHLVGKGNVTVTTQMLEDASRRVSKYLSLLFLLNVTFGISIGVGLFLIGIPNALLWGILAAAFRFIPYLGPWMAAVMPVGLSMAVSTGWEATILTLLLFAVLELLNNNFLEPWLYGKNTGVSAVAVMLAAVFWTWLWGPVGLLLATPLTVCVLVVGKHVPQLSFLNILLGTEPVFEPQERIYQRLLAGDQEEAGELFEENLSQRPLIEVYDSVLIPALAMAERHWQLGELDDAKHNFIVQSVKEMIQDQGERDQEAQSTAADPVAVETDGESHPALETSPPPIRVLCLPARDEADAIAALMLAQVLESNDRLVQSVALTSLIAEMAKLVDHRNVDVICVSATPPAAVMHARYLCRRIRARLPKVKLIVGLWSAQDDLSKAKERIGCDAIVVVSLTEAHEELVKLIQLHSPPLESKLLSKNASTAVPVAQT